MPTFTASRPTPPPMSLRAKLAWQYFFGRTSDWAIVHTDDGYWIVTDEAYTLEEAQIFSEDEELIEWLEEISLQHLEGDSVEYLRNFCLVPELIDHDVALAMEKLILAKDFGMEKIS